MISRALPVFTTGARRDIFVRRIRLVLLCTIMLGASVASFGHVRAEPLPPLTPNPSTWNAYCHNQGGNVAACCIQFGSECHGRCASTDNKCNNICEQAREECIGMDTVKKGGGINTKPVVPGKPIEEKQRR